MNGSKDETECPKCGGKEFGTGKKGGYAKMSSGRFNTGSTIIHTVFCTSCGYIVESYAAKPQNFR